MEFKRILNKIETKQEINILGEILTHLAFNICINFIILFLVTGYIDDKFGKISINLRILIIVTAICIAGIQTCKYMIFDLSKQVFLRFKLDMIHECLILMKRSVDNLASNK